MPASLAGRVQALWGGEGGWHEAMGLGCVPLAAPIGLSPLYTPTLCGSERVVVVSTEPPHASSCLTTPGYYFWGGGGGSGSPVTPSWRPCTTAPHTTALRTAASQRSDPRTTAPHATGSGSVVPHTPQGLGREAIRAWGPCPRDATPERLPYDLHLNLLRPPPSPDMRTLSSGKENETYQRVLNLEADVLGITNLFLASNPPFPPPPEGGREGMYQKGWRGGGLAAPPPPPPRVPLWSPPKPGRKF